MVSHHIVIDQTIYHNRNVVFVKKNALRKKLNLERLTVRLGLTVIYFPIFRQARPDFFRVCLQLRKDVTI